MAAGRKISKKQKTGAGGNLQKHLKKYDDDMQKMILQELKKRERYRAMVVRICTILAAVCIGYFGIYYFYTVRTSNSNKELAELKEKNVMPSTSSDVVIHYDGIKETPDVLEEYKNLYNKNKKLIGWLKIDDTKIDYPIMQTANNEYYLDHNFNQEYDKNGSLFLDKDCDVLKPSTNFIVYGHHMKNGQMFGQLDKYSSESFYKEHSQIQFDTIYEKGTYEVMYVFRSRIYGEDEIVFKYYQFIDAMTEKEFDSYMQEMAALSLYDTGVSAKFGDQLLTLSTCDYQVQDGRFVVVARKVH